MSQWGFGAAAQKLERQAKMALRGMMDVAQDAFDENFENEDAGNKTWDNVVRDVPPPILDVTGELRAYVAAKGNVTVTSDKATLLVDPFDKRGRPYAEYHMEGNEPSASQPNGMPRREYIVQTNALTDKQEDIILNTIDNAFLP